MDDRVCAYKGEERVKIEANKAAEQNQ